MNKIYKIVIEGYVIHKDGESHPDEWDWGNILGAGEFIEAPDLTIIELVEATEVERAQK